jgi:hypothetical protein
VRRTAHRRLREIPARLRLTSPGYVAQQEPGAAIGFHNQTAGAVRSLSPQEQSRFRLQSFVAGATKD